MSSLPIPSATTAALPAANIHPHGHGHKKGALTDPFTDSSSSTAAQIPAGSTQNLFGSLFNSLQQIIGAQPAAAKPAASLTNAAGLSAAASSTAAGAAAAAGAKLNVMA
jgi:hypothetical protein